MEQLHTETTGPCFREGRHGKKTEKQRNNGQASITLYLARQNMTFRSHDERSSVSLNKGNFLELVQGLAKYDSTIKMHLEEATDIFVVLEDTE